MIFRYSTLQTADECLRKFQEIHINGRVQESTSLDLEFGTAIHLAIRAHYEGGDAAAVFEMFWQTLQDKSIPQGRYSFEQLRDLGLYFLDRFVRQYASKFKPIEIEKQLQIPMAGHTYQGTLDMLCEYEGQVTLIDWKTAGYPYTMKKLVTNEQLYGYAHLAQQQFNITIQQVMYVVFVKSSKRIQTNIRAPLSQEKLKDMVGNIESKVRVVSSLKEFPRNSNCKYCVCDLAKEIAENE